MAHRILLSALTAWLLVLAPPAALGARAQPCAAREPQLAAPRTGGPRQLVPSGAATLLLCRYRGLNPAQTALRLRSSRLVTDRAEIASISAALDQLPRAQGLVHCPMDDGSAILATFSYPGGKDVAIRIGLTGCVNVTGPYQPARTAAGSSGTKLLATLERLVP